MFKDRGDIMKNNFYILFRDYLTAGKQPCESTFDFLTRCFFDAIEKSAEDTISRNFERRVASKILCRDKNGNPVLHVSEERKDPAGRTYRYSEMKRIKW